MGAVRGAGRPQRRAAGRRDRGRPRLVRPRPDGPHARMAGRVAWRRPRSWPSTRRARRSPASTPTGRPVAARPSTTRSPRPGRRSRSASCASGSGPSPASCAATSRSCRRRAGSSTRPISSRSTTRRSRTTRSTRTTCGRSCRRPGRDAARGARRGRRRDAWRLGHDRGRRVRGLVGRRDDVRAPVGRWRKRRRSCSTRSSPNAAARTPDVRRSPRGPGWVELRPPVVDGHAADRANAWFLSGHRRLTGPAPERRVPRNSNDPGRVTGVVGTRATSQGYVGRGDRELGQVELLLELLERAEADHALRLLRRA